MEDRDAPHDPAPPDAGVAAHPHAHDAGRALEIPARPPHRDPAMLLVVLLGGVVGTSARYGLKIALPADGWPWGTWTVNVVGAFLLGLIVAALASRGPDVGRRRTLRLLLGTGVMGSFTTYSSLAVETERLLAGGRVGLGLAYAGATLLLGLAASLAGLVLGARGRGTRRAARRRVEEVEA